MKVQCQCYTEHKGIPVRSRKTYVGGEVFLHSFLTLALEGSEWSVSGPGRSGEIAH
jgi:hypothetical protein